MTQLQIECKTKLNQILIKIVYPSNLEISYNFQLTVSIYEQNIVTKNQTLAYKQIFHLQQRQIVIKDLKYSTMYKVVIANKYGPNSKAIEKIKNIFVFTEAARDQEQQNYQPQIQRNQISYPQRPHSSHPNRNSQNNRASNSPKKYIKNSSTNANQHLCNSQLLIKTLAQSNHIVHKDKAHKYMLQSRKCRNIKQFINQKQGRRINRAQVSDKMMLYIQSKLLFSQVYKYRDGCRFFQNDWGMGPFYSYDVNQKQIKRQ